MHAYIHTYVCRRAGKGNERQPHWDPIWERGGGWRRDGCAVAEGRCRDVSGVFNLPVGPIGPIGPIGENIYILLSASATLPDVARRCPFTHAVDVNQFCTHVHVRMCMLVSPYSLSYARMLTVTHLPASIAVTAFSKRLLKPAAPAPPRHSFDRTRAGAFCQSPASGFRSPAAARVAQTPSTRRRRSGRC